MSCSNDRPRSIQSSFTNARMTLSSARSLRALLNICRLVFVVKRENAIIRVQLLSSESAAGRKPRNQLSGRREASANCALCGINQFAS